MTPTAKSVFDSNVNNLPRSERLRLAAMILQDLALGDPTVLDYSDAWSQEDMTDVQEASARSQDFLGARRDDVSAR